MPKCIITKCPHRTGGKPTNPTVTLHGFPNSLERIKEWLLQTGQLYQHLDELADIILEGKRCDLYRMCSTHFVEDSYVNTGKRKKLKRTAVPTIFPEPPEGRSLIEELHIIESKNRDNQTDEGGSSVCFLCGSSPSVASSRILVDQSTQTESNIWSPTVSQVQHIYLVTHTTPNGEIAKSQETACPNIGTRLPFECSEGSSNEDSVRALLMDPLSTFIEFSIPQPPSQVEEQHAEGSILSFSLGGGTGLEGTVVQRKNEHQESLQKSVSSSKISARQYYLEDEQFNTNTNGVRDHIADMVNESKYIVFEQCLDNLLHKVKCQDPSGCSKVVHKYNKEFHGSAVIIRGTCEDGHYFRIWESQPKISRFYAGNLLLAASLLVTDQNFHKIQAFLRCFNIRHISETKFHQYQRQFIFPSIHDSWKMHQAQVQNDMQDTPVAICGNGQCNRSGHNPEYCVYSMMDMISDKILDFEIVQSTQCTSSTAIEYGFDICMTRALSRGQDIAIFASDRNVGVMKLMKTKYNSIRYQYNVRQYAKCLKSKLTYASRGHGGITIKPWISKILKHFWWSIQTSKGNAALLKEKWLSLLKHIQNIHKWHDGVLYHKCAHAAYSEETCSGTLWLKEGTIAYDKVLEIICNPQLMEDLDHLVWNCHTSVLDIFHSNAFKCCTKCIHVSIDAMEARTRLAAIIHNRNIDQMPAAVQRATLASTPLGTKLISPKKRKKWLMKAICEPVTNAHLIPILQDTLRIAEGTKTSTWVSKELLINPNIIKIEKQQNSNVAATQFPRLIYRKKRRLDQGLKGGSSNLIL